MAADRFDVPGRQGRPVHRLGLPRGRARRLRARRPARLRRRRGDGLDRPGQPGGRRAARRCPSYHGMPVLAVHAPMPAAHPAGLGHRPVGQARALDRAGRRRWAPTRWCVHPPFRWQREYARELRRRDRRCASATTGIALRGGEHVPVAGAASREIEAYLPDWDPVPQPYANATLDLSHTADVGLRRRRRWPTASAPGCATSTSPTAPARPRTSTWCPGAAPSRARELLEPLAAQRLRRHTSSSRSTPASWRRRTQREVDLAEALAFARLHLAVAPGPSSAP